MRPEGRRGQAGLVVLVGGLFLAGCSEPAPPPTPPIPPLPNLVEINPCPAVTPLSDTDQDALREEFDALPESSKLKAAIREWVALRQAAKVCAQNAQNTPK